MEVMAFTLDSRTSRVSLSFPARYFLMVSSLPCLSLRETWTRVWYWFCSTRERTPSLEMPSCRLHRKRLPPY